MPLKVDLIVSSSVSFTAVSVVVQRGRARQAMGGAQFNTTVFAVAPRELTS